MFGGTSVGEETRGGGLGRRSADAAERTRGAIVGAALTLFAERGFEGVSLRDVAQEAGTTHGLIRHHFGSKEGVWRAVVDAADAEYVSAMRPVLIDADADEDPEGAVAAIVRGLVLVSSSHPEIVRLLVHEGARGSERLDYILDRVEPLRRAVGPLFARLRRRGLLEQFDEEEFFLFLLMSAATPFALSALTGRVLGRDVGSEEHARRHADRIVRTLFGNT
jgi:AcrR family transcriptional regulator